MIERADAPAGAGGEDWSVTAYPGDLRRHQREALDALDRAAAADETFRAWVVLPPGAGKTLVGLEAARRLGRPVVVFGPNTAIQGQWVRAWQEFVPQSLAAGTSRTLDTPVTALTYQALATFDPDVEVDEEGRQQRGRTSRRRSGRLLDQVHDNGLALVRALESAGPITLVLDECHHLLEVWGRLLAELLEDLPDACVIGLTGTPPETLTSDQAALVAELFGAPLYSTSIPSVVREGHLAPFAELAWLTTPSPTEAQWLAGQAERFAELRADLLRPGVASTGLLGWLDERFVTRRLAGRPGEAAADDVQASWSALELAEPALTAAALRFHHAELLGLPDGAVMREEHRREPSADDWVAVLDDYVVACLMPSDDPRDQRLVDEVRAALPGIGFHLTRRGVRRGRSPVDRVLARSEAKTTATVEILAAEGLAIGDRLRALVLCDHESASATLPPGLRGVLDAEAGSARLVLATLVADARTAALRPVLVTGRTVSAAADTARDLVAFVTERYPDVDLDPVPEAASGVVEVTGRWRARIWVAAVTRFYEAGRCRILVGTRGLLGEGWDARGVNALVDLTTATTSTAVVQTRGRALRVDPSWPEKVANIWTVVCVTEDHPGGARDWSRFVRKHDGYFAVTDSGEIASGISHVDPRLSPYAPPPAADFDAENVLMLERAADRPRVRRLWQVGTPYRDEVVKTIRVLPTRTATWRARTVAVPATGPLPPDAVPGERGVWRPEDVSPAPKRTRSVRQVVHTYAPLAAGTAAATIAAAVWLPPGPAFGGIFAFLCFVAVALGEVRARRRAERAAAGLVQRLGEGIDASAFAYAVAEAMAGAGLSPHGADAVRAVVEADGGYRFALEGCGSEPSAVFATALDEVLSPVWAPRYLVPRYVMTPPADEDDARRAGRALLDGTLEPNAVVYHAVPKVLGANRTRVDAFGRAWNRWVSGGQPLRSTTPEGEGVLVTHRGADPFDAATALRVAWT